MKKISMIIVFTLLCLVACQQIIVNEEAQMINEGPEVIAELAAKIPDDLTPSRGYRNCELFDLGIKDDQIVVNVWNNAGQGHNCSDEWLVSVDREQYLVDGPRWQPIDFAISVDDNLNLMFDDGGFSDDSAVIREIPAGSGVDMVLAATVDVGPIQGIARKFGVDIDDSGNIPPELSQAILAQVFDNTPYNVTEVNRVYNTFWVYQAGQLVYVITDGECEYAMKYYSATHNPALRSEEMIQDLTLAEMPPEFSYEVRLFSDDVYVLNLDGLQYVMTDEFGNSYDRLWCGDSDVPYEIVN